MHCYYHITDCTDPYQNLALEELLFDTIEPDEVVLYLWQNGDTVVIGRNQNAWKECRLEAFSAQGGKLARRLSGGGAVYHDLGNQNFTFLAAEGLYNVSKQTEVIRLAVSSFGIAAEQSGRNDILAEGRKFSGNAYYRTDRASFQHGTILISSDLSRLDHYLMPSQEKLKAKGVESARGRVVNLRDLNPELNPEEMREGLIAAFRQVYGVAPKPLPPERIPQDRLRVLTARYASDEWRLGRLRSFTYEDAHRFSFGEVSFHFAVEEGVIQVVSLYSDAMDGQWICQMEEAFVGAPFDGRALGSLVPESGLDPAHKTEVTAYLSEALTL